MKNILFFYTIWINIAPFVKLNQVLEIPQFLLLPDPEIYEDENAKEVNIQVIVSPVNSSIMLAYLSIGSGGYSDEMKALNFSSPSSFISSDEVGVIVESRQLTGKIMNEELWKLKIVRCSFIFEKSLHILARNSLGTLTSRPFKIIRKVLNPFPLVHHESAEFIMGNVGQIVCMIPHSKPSPPYIEFLHDNVPINTTKGSKYKKIYLPPGAMILLIKNLEPKDSGSYTCTASFPGTKSFQRSDKKTRLTVTTPKKDIKPRFRLSSYDNERKEEKVIDAVEGSNITLYCLYESTPAAEVTWYYPNSKRYESDTQFGTLSINNVQLDDASDFSCLANEVQTRSFKLKVLALPRFSSTPLGISFKSHASQMVDIKCELQNSVPNPVIKWFHDGKILTEKDDSLKFTKNILQIKSLEKKHLGIYQCWLENDGNLWASGVTVIKDFVVFQERESQRENLSIIDKRTAPGLTIHLECSLLQSQKDSKTNFTVKWLRQKDSLELIEWTGNKYVVFKKKSEGTVILSIINPTRNQDEGIYICQLYDQNGGLLHTVRYQLTIDDQKSNEANQYQLKSTDIPSKKLVHPEPSVSRPEAVRINEYAFGVTIKWNVLPDNKILDVIDHFRLEFQNKTVDKIQQTNLVEDRKSDEWSEIFMIDDYPTTNQITIVDQHILRPNVAIRFRVIIFLKVLSQILASNNLNQTVFDALRSSWSNVIEFNNILNCKLSISNKAVTPTSVEVMWTHNCVRESDWHPITFDILYVSMTDCLRSKKCQPDKHLKNFESMLIFPEFKDLIQVKTERNDVDFFKANITDLRSKSEYVIAVYGKVVIIQDVFYIPLSNIIKVSTLEDKDENRLSLEITSDNDDTRNRVIFLILGSLAGVLFVVAAVMFGMCTWYYMKKHMKIHKIHMKPNDSSQPTFLFHYPPSSLSSPLCYGARINPLSPYQQALTTNSNLIYYPNQTVGKSPMISCNGNNQSDLWPLNYYSHSPNTMAVMADKFSSDRDSDLDSICNSEKNMNNNPRRPIVMGVDQASSTYSRIGSERRFSIGALNIMSNDYPNNFQNMTIPRQSVVPIVFPEPPDEPQPDKYLVSYQRTLSPTDIKSQLIIDNLDENSASVPFLDKNSSWHNNSMNSLLKTNFVESSIEKIPADNPWAADTYYDPYSSNSSVGNETNQLVRINP